MTNRCWMALCLLGTSARTLVGAMALANKEVSVSQLIESHRDEIAQLQKITEDQGISLDQAPYSNPVFFLRYCLSEEGLLEDQYRNTLSWRTGPGKSICEAAVSAVTQATVNGKWNNAPVVALAPFSSQIIPFLSSATITTTSSQGDLVYCIRAGKIDDSKLMEQVTVDQMSDFFLYTKEVNNLVANDRSLATDQLLCVLAANDLSGVQLIGGSSEFRQALSQSSKQATEVYPDSTVGPTLLLNLPTLLSALVKLFTPLFPDAVKKRIKFRRGPLKDVADLSMLARDTPERAKFWQQLDELVYQG